MRGDVFATLLYVLVCFEMPYSLVFSMPLLHFSARFKPTAAQSSVIVSGGSQGEGAEAAGVFYSSSSRDNLFSGTSLLALFYDIINSPISSDQP